MAMHRKNTSKGFSQLDREQPWFSANVKRQRTRNKMASASRRKNRK
jgi:hypothetical protein